MKQLSYDDARAAVYGGCILGGGGGGHIADGLATIEEIYSTGLQPTLVNPDELDDDDLVACVALVGAPSAPDAYFSGADSVHAARSLSASLEGGLAAIMTNENGGGTTVNGWIQAATLGLPVIDAPANGRAHPTASMGSMNLHEKDDYISVQAFAGGQGSDHMEAVLRGNLDDVSSVVRYSSVRAGGVVTVCRNPVPVSYIKDNAACGAISQAIELGTVYLQAGEGLERIKAVAEHLGGEIIASGPVENYQLKMEGGFDVGLLDVAGVSLTFWNEYMTATKAGERIATFPDLVMTFDNATGEPVVTAKLTEGMDVSVLYLPASSLILGSTMTNKKLLATTEPIIGQTIVEETA